MKKLFNKINTKISRSVVLGLILALTFTAVQSAVANQGTRNTVPFIANSSSLVSRIGSLSIAGPLPSIMTSTVDECIIGDTPGLLLSSGQVGTCLNVSGLGSFSNLLVQQVVLGGNAIVGDPTLSSTTSFDGGTSNEPSFVVKADGTSIMVGGLVYPDPATFNPRDVNTSERTVCSDSSGKLVVCSATVNGQCGSAHGGTSLTAPTANLCSAGTASTVSFSGGYYSWTCQGSNGGTDNACLSSQTSQFACTGTYQKNSIDTNPGTCTGTPSDTTPPAVCGQKLQCGCTIGTCTNSGCGGCGCQWVGSVAECNPLGEAACNASSNCSWQTGFIAPSCSDYNGGFNVLTGQLNLADPTGCENAGCTWEAETTSTIEQRVCSDFINENTTTNSFGLEIPGCDSESSCTWGAQTNPPETNWLVGTWGTCSGGTQTRSVSCPDGYVCPLTEPVSSQTCTSSGGGGTGGKIICGELYRQGLLSEELWLADNTYAQEHVSKESLAVYHAWAEPVVYAMSKSSLVTEIVRPGATAWAEHMAFLEGTREENNFLGSLFHTTFLPIHDLISGTPSDTEFKVSNFNLAGLLIFIMFIIFLISAFLIVLLPIPLVIYIVSRDKKKSLKLLRPYRWILLGFIIPMIISILL